MVGLEEGNGKKGVVEAKMKLIGMVEDGAKVSMVDGR